MPSTSLSVRTLRPALALTCLAIAGSGCVTVKVDDSGSPEPMAYADGGVAAYEGKRDVVQVDCCEIGTDTEQSLCDDLYGGTVPAGLIIEDTCDTDADSDTDDGAETDPCAGMEGLTALTCQFTSTLTTTSDTPADPCAGLEAFELLLCQAGGALTGTATDTGSNPLGGLGALGDLAGGLGDLGDLFGQGGEGGDSGGLFGGTVN